MNREELYRLNELRSKGPWKYIHNEYGDSSVIDGDGATIACDMQYYPWTFQEHDARFIVSLVNNFDEFMEAYSYAVDNGFKNDR